MLIIEKIIERINNKSNIKAIKGKINKLEDINNYICLGCTVRKDFYNEEITINYLTRRIIEFCNPEFNNKITIPYDLVEIILFSNIEEFLDINRYFLPELVIKIYIKPGIY